MEKSKRTNKFKTRFNQWLVKKLIELSTPPKWPNI